MLLSHLCSCARSYLTLSVHQATLQSLSFLFYSRSPCPLACFCQRAGMGGVLHLGLDSLRFFPFKQSGMRESITHSSPGNAYSWAVSHLPCPPDLHPLATVFRPYAQATCLRKIVKSPPPHLTPGLLGTPMGHPFFPTPTEARVPPLS